MNLSDYIQGKRKGKPAHRIEREAMKDPFLAESLEGFDSVPGNHIESLERIQKRISSRTQTRNKRVTYWATAASLLLCISIGGYFFWNQPKKDLYSVAAVKEKDLPEKMVEKDLLPEIASNRPNVAPFTQNDQSEPKVREPEKKIAASVAAPAVVADMQEEKAVEIQAPEAKILTENKVETRQFSAKQASEQKEVPNQINLRQISGTVVDEQGEPLPGVSITQKGFAQGYITDQNGRFNLTLKDTTPLFANQIGFMTQRIKPDAGQSQLITMQEDKTALSEVVVTGYASQKKSNLAGSISVVKPQDQPEPVPTIGTEAYRKYIDENKKSPKGGACAGKKGLVILEFKVDKNGIPQDIKVIQSLCDAADKEAVRLLSSGCKWTSGKNKGRLEITF